MLIGVVDYTVGNIGSVLNAVRKTGATPVVLKKAEEAKAVDALILPGVGTYLAAHAMVQEFREVVLEKPTLAICLGMQLLFENSEEGGGRGLGVFKGTVEKIDAVKVPHIGWSYTHSNHWTVEGGYYYYLHSYGVLWNPHDETHVAYVKLGRNYAAAVYKSPMLAVQFHPERSGKAGLRLIQNFFKHARA